MILDRILCPALLAALATFGCSDAGHRLGGGEAGQRMGGSQAAGTSTAPLSYPLCENGAEFELIDDMEDDDSAILPIAARAGTWFSYDDKTGGDQFPYSNADTFIMSPLEPPVGESRTAAHTYGDGFSKWGAGIGFELYIQKTYDLSRYAGVTFLAKGEPGSNPIVRFAVADVGTTPRGKICRDKDEKNPEDPSAPLCDAHFGISFKLSSSFERLSFLWQDLTQESWADPPRPALDLTQSYGMRFQASEDQPFDFWIDDLALICRRD